MPLKKLINYQSNDRQWHSHSNYLFTSENRLLFFDFQIGNSNYPFSFSFEDLEKLSPANGAWTPMRTDFTNVGTLEIAVRRRPADKNYVWRKKEETIRKLGQQIDMIEQFNGDSDLPAGAGLFAFMTF